MSYENSLNSMLMHLNMLLHDEGFTITTFLKHQYRLQKAYKLIDTFFARYMHFFLCIYFAKLFYCAKLVFMMVITYQRRRGGLLLYNGRRLYLEIVLSYKPLYPFATKFKRIRILILLICSNVDVTLISCIF